MTRRLISVLLGLLLTLLFTNIAQAKLPEGQFIPARQYAPSPAVPTGPALTLSYAQIINGGAAVYASPSDGGAGVAPIQWLAPGFVFVSLASTTPVAYGGQNWYALHQGGYVNANNILLYAPSKFHGVQLDRQPDHSFAWVTADTRLSNAAGRAPDPALPVLTRYTRVTLLEEQDLNGVAWYRVGDGQWISQFRLGIVRVSQRPDSVGPYDKWIEVNLYEQTLAAYEGDQMVYATLVSSGLPKWPTDPGLFQIYDKVRQDKMEREQGKPDYYYLQDIPWIMYFDDDQALHTAYWHDGFGAVHSHGCVNLAPEDAMWLYFWTTPTAGGGDHTLATPDDPGTWVWVHN
jgi:hypothetical protein